MRLPFLVSPFLRLAQASGFVSAPVVVPLVFFSEVQGGFSFHANTNQKKSTMS